MMVVNYNSQMQIKKSLIIVHIRKFLEQILVHYAHTENTSRYGNIHVCDDRHTNGSFFKNTIHNLIIFDVKIFNCLGMHSILATDEQFQNS